MQHTVAYGVFIDWNWTFPGGLRLALALSMLVITAAVAVWACLAVAAIAVFADRYGRPDTWLEGRWHEFRNLNAVQPASAGRFGTAASNRYDYWRVAVRELQLYRIVDGRIAERWYAADRAAARGEGRGG